MIKKLDRVKRVPKKATAYFTDFVETMDDSLKQAQIGKTCDILITDVEKGFVHFNIESWNTFKFTLRLSDMMPVLEGRDLNNPKMGWDKDKLVKKIQADLETWDDYCKLSDTIDKEKQFIVGYDKVVTHDGDNGRGIYRVIFDRPIYKVAGKVTDKHMDVIELGPRHAVEYALNYVRGAVPVEVYFLGTESENINAEYLNKMFELKKQIMELIKNAASSKTGMTIASTECVLALAEHAGFYKKVR